MYCLKKNTLKRILGVYSVGIDFNSLQELQVEKYPDLVLLVSSFVMELFLFRTIKKGSNDALKSKMGTITNVVN
jgi:hypothetical protein